MSRPAPRPDPGFILDGLGAEVERCASCAAVLRSEEVPGVEDDAAWARLATLRDPQAFGGWLTSIARRRAIDHHRRAVETTELPADLEAPDAAAPRAEAT